MSDIDKEIRAYFNAKKRLKTISLILKMFSFLVGFLGVLPIKIFLWYSVLKAINADRLLWFCFFAYVPLSIVWTCVSEGIKRVDKTIAELSEDKE